MEDTTRDHVNEEDPGGTEGRARSVDVFGKRVPMPGSRFGRIALGSVLVAGGVLGFLPVLGFWMVPVGLLVLSQDVPRVRRWRRKLVLRLSGKRDGGREKPRR